MDIIVCLIVTVTACLSLLMGGGIGWNLGVNCTRRAWQTSAVKLGHGRYEVDIKDDDSAVAGFYWNINLEDGDEREEVRGNGSKKELNRWGYVHPTEEEIVKREKEEKEGEGDLQGDFNNL